MSRTARSLGVGVIRSLLAVAAYPSAIAAAAAGTAWALAAGVQPQLVGAGVAAVGVAAVAGLERALPYREAWARSHGDVGADVLHALISFGLAGELARRAVAATDGLVGGWPSAWPWLAQVLLAVLVAELGTWAAHRAQHELGWTWSWHAVHHGAPRLYFLNAARLHPLDGALSAVVALGPLALLGATPEALAGFTAVAGVHAAFQHSNADVRLGPLNLVLSGPEIHRWHHSRELREANANYGQIVLVWDLLFGTRRVPPGEPPVDVGLTDRDLPADWWGQVASIWRR